MEQRSNCSRYSRYTSYQYYLKTSLGLNICTRKDLKIFYYLSLVHCTFYIYEGEKNNGVIVVDTVKLLPLHINISSKQV